MSLFPRRKRKSTTKAERKPPLPPRWRWTWAGEDGVEHHELLMCRECGARLAGFDEGGSPSYKGGWRLTRAKDPEVGVVWAQALCHCEVGQAIAAVNPTVPFVPAEYPCNEAMSEARVKGIDPWKWQDWRTMRAVNEAELRGWLRQHGVEAKPAVGDPNEELVF